ncbi:MAG: hypothetical protein IPH18_13285 [Chitinophagaceae bacterium]|nr:hypothetical protein [Chitinophagaceae bacterium]MBK8952410.1 hypothetical protein [Chitinophagaceae bacterium]
MKGAACIAMILGITVSTYSQTLRRPTAAAYVRLGSYSIKHSDIFSVTGNQASLAQIKNTSAGMFAERKFMLAELNNFAAVAGFPTKSGNFGLTANHSGFSENNTSVAGLAYARSLGSKIDAGVQFNYSRISIAGYGDAATVSFEAGIITHLTEKLHAGLHVDNPVGGKFGKDQEEKLSAVYTFGMGYDVSDKFYVSAEIEKEENQPVNITAGFQYKLIQQLLIRAGMSSASSTVWAGAGLSLKSFRIDILAGYHPQLGITPGLMLLFNINKKGDGQN